MPAGGNNPANINKESKHMAGRKTNKELGKELDVHPRQISKSRKRGWIWKDGKKVKYTAPK